MNKSGFKYVYGPVPSRRLGLSLGIDIIPHKICTYDCIYCQLGRTDRKTMKRQEYYPHEKVLAELKIKLANTGRIDYITIAGSGEPTLHSKIGNLIDSIKSMTDIPVAVLTNGSMLWMTDVQNSLMNADLVLPSLDAADETLFQYVNRPQKEITFEQMVNGLSNFTGRFQGKVWLEIFLLGGVTGITSEVKKLAEITKRIKVSRVQLHTVYRPAAESFAFPVSHDRLLYFKDFFPGQADIISQNKKPGAPVVSHSGLSEKDILAIIKRHPSTPSDVARGLGIHVTEALKYLEKLAAAEKVRVVSSEGHHFYLTERKD